MSARRAPFVMSTNRCNLAAIFLCEILTVEKDEAFRLGRTTMFAIMPFYNLKLLGLISLDTIAMRHDDLFAMLDSRPAKTAPSRAVGE